MLINSISIPKSVPFGKSPYNQDAETRKIIREHLERDLSADAFGLYNYPRKLSPKEAIAILYSHIPKNTSSFYENVQSEPRAHKVDIGFINEYINNKKLREDSDIFPLAREIIPDGLYVGTASFNDVDDAKLVKKAGINSVLSLLCGNEKAVKEAELYRT